MESIQSKLSVSAMTAYFGIFKEPRGFIRLLQFIFAIFAFATACNGNSSTTVNAFALPNAISTSWSYPYNLKNTQIQTPNDNSQTLSNANDVQPSAQFFVFTGVTAMLLSLAFAVVYVVLDRQYRNDERIPIADLVVTIVWAIFWLAGSSAWAQGVNNIRAQTGWQNVAQRSGLCSNAAAPCTPSMSGTYANIIVSVIFGFLNFILWVGSAWFVYKETKFFKGRAAQQQQQQTQPPTNDFSNISSPPMQQQPPFRSPPMQQQPSVRPPGSMG